MSEPRPPWQWQIDDLKSDLEVLRCLVRQLTAALEALAERVRALEGDCPEGGQHG
jgi:hypothetical protein